MCRLVESFAQPGDWLQSQGQSRGRNAPFLSLSVNPIQFVSYLLTCEHSPCISEDRDRLSPSVTGLNTQLWFLEVQWVENTVLMQSMCKDPFTSLVKSDPKKKTWSLWVSVKINNHIQDIPTQKPLPRWDHSPPHPNPEIQMLPIHHPVFLERCI